MKSNYVKLLFGILILSIGLSLVILELDALMDNACRGRDFCPEVEEACTSWGFELFYYYKIGAICETDYGPCVSLIRVGCLDNEEMVIYYTYAQCWSDPLPGECGYN